MTSTSVGRPAGIAAKPSVPPERSASGRAWYSATRFYVLMTVAAVTWFIPLLWMLSMALTPNDVLQRSSTRLFPSKVTFSNFLKVFDNGQLGRWFVNSFVVTMLTTIITVLFCAMAGFAFARMNFPGRRPLFVITLAGLMVPKEAMFIPLFLMVSNAHLQNTYQALILPRLAAPLGVFLMTQFFSKIPVELEEAARIDGAGPWRIFYGIMLPLARPAMASLAIFTFVLTWNDYLWPLVSSTQPDWFTVTTGLASLQSNFSTSTNLGDLMARGVVGSLPLIIVFMIFQRQLIRGITLGSGEK